MPFLQGRVTFTRLRVGGRSASLSDEYLTQLERHAIGRQRVASGDGVQVGWTAGEHILDTDFGREKNVFDDALHFALRVDTPRLPADLIRAYTHIELPGLVGKSEQPTGRQRREARLRARERLEAEGKDGRFVSRKTYPVLWDGRAREVLLGATAQGAVERFVTLFSVTFERKLEWVGAGRRAYYLAEPREQTRAVDDAAPADFVRGAERGALSWLPDEASRDFLGNEFLLWLWYVLDHEGDAIRAADDSDIVAMFSRNLVLECPQGETGRETIHSEVPTRLPEARRAVQAGKLPRQAGLTLVRHDRQYELTLHAESLAVTSAKLPEPEESEPRARLDERIDQVRHLTETLDLLYDAFGQRRLTAGWSKELTKIRKWLEGDKRAALPATG